MLLRFILLLPSGQAQVSSPGSSSDTDAPPDQCQPDWDYCPTADNATAALNIFPYCVCQSYRCGISPYRLTFAGVVSGPQAMQLCFSIDAVGGMPQQQHHLGVV
jgi:hypothetical protein